MEEQEIDKWTEYFQTALNNLAQDETNSLFSYVTFDDIKSVNTLTKAEGQPFLVIRAPKGTTLEVPLPDQMDDQQEFPYKMRLESQTDEILIYVVSDVKATDQMNAST